jgi:hypothetical protein
MGLLGKSKSLVLLAMFGRTMDRGMAWHWLATARGWPQAVRAAGGGPGALAYRSGQPREFAPPKVGNQKPGNCPAGSKAWRCGA